jgi:hypothetical protein
MCEGYQQRHDREWEIARWQVAVILNTKRKSGSPAIRPSDLIELSFDRKTQKSAKIKSIYTPEEYADLKKKLGIG